MSGFGNPFKEIPRVLFKRLKEKLSGHAVCHFCERKRDLKYLERDYLDRWECSDDKEICMKIKQRNCQ